VISTITSRYARQLIREKKWEARNDVVATNNAGDTLRTEHLTWDEQAGKIYSSDFVRIVRPDQNITGVGFEADQNMRNWRIRNPKGPIYVQINREAGSQEDSVTGNFFPMEPVKPGNE
jgi:LPS export ABC transporter protein LptC